jgi:2-keto-4-pentenoate hydratase/2-oxohepta-3-ene-1,7-dioic acid hydratase in catechol pathway
LKLLSYTAGGRASWGVVVDGGVVDAAKRTNIPDLKSALGRLSELAALAKEKPDHKLSDIKYLPVIPNPDKIFCIGLNYQTHVNEGGRPGDAPTKPIVFTRFPNSQVGHNEPLVRPKASEKFDFEAELAVIIGTRGRHVSKANFESVIAGYSCYNDGSIRDFQRHSSQWIPGKNFENSGSFGPYLVTKDEVPDITKQTLTSVLNGQEMQRAVISDLLFDIPTLIEYISTFTTLEPGDVIVTGTTGGVGMGRNPQVWMKPGDEIIIEVTKVGKLVNSIVQEA